MTTYRLFPSTNGPSSPVSYSGNFLAGVIFKVTQGGMWFNGYWKWVATGEDVTARKFALWQITGANSGVLMPAATVMSGTLTAGQWNFVPLATPIPLSIGTAYNACTGWSAVSGHGFSDSDITGAGTGAGDSFGTGGHTTGITQGPLYAYSDGINGGTKGEPYGSNQGLFGTGGTDASATMPASQSNSGNFWMDVQVSDTGPAAYAGPYSIWPGNIATNSVVAVDASDNYDVGTEFAVSVPCTVGKIRYYSPATATQLATSATIWSIGSGGLSGTAVYTNTSPSWSGAAASGWVSITPPAGTVLPPGKYKVSVYNGAATPAGCFAKDANTDYWRSGDGASGITWGPLSVPNLASASLAFNYNGNAGGTPPFSDGTTLAGQSTFTQGPPDQYPYLVALVATPTTGSSQNYWVDLEVTPVPPVAMSPAVAQPGRTWLRRYHHRQIPALTLVAASSVSGSGGLAVPAVSATGSGTEVFSGQGTAAVPLPILAGAGSEEFTASGGPVLPAATVTGSGGVALTAAGALTLPGPVLAGAGSLEIQGTGSLAVPRVTLAGSAGGSFTGSGSLAIPAVQTTGSGSEGFAGSGSLPVPSPALAGAGAGVLTGSGGLALPAVTISGSGAEEFAGPGTPLLPVPAVSGSGTAGAVFSGSGGLLVPQPGFTGAGLRGYTGTAVAAVPAPVLAGSGGETFTGSGSLVLPAVTASATVPAVFGYGFLVPAAGPTAAIETAAPAGAVIGGGTP